MALFDLSEVGIGEANSSASSSLSSSPAPVKDLFAEESRKGWHKPDTMEARCDLSIERLTMSPHASVPVVSIWKKSIKGRKLTDIKADDTMVPYFADHLTPVIQRVLGNYLRDGHWAICATPKRRHLTQNFACRIASEIGSRLQIPYYEDVAIAHSRQRVAVEFDLGVLPAEPNLIIFDDFVTTGSTIAAMKRLLDPLGKNLFFVVGINNNM